MTRTLRTRFRTKPRPSFRPTERYVLGIDEVGTGAWAGPFGLGAVVLPSFQRIEGVKDSKKMTKGAREELAPIIQKKASVSVVYMVAVDKIKSRGHGVAWQDGVLHVLRSTLVELDELGVPRDIVDVIIDGSVNYALIKRAHSEISGSVNISMVAKADTKYPAVSAASVIAKVARDDFMLNLAKIYPEYGFDRNVGYGTEEHAWGLYACGKTSEHRPLVDKFHVKKRERYEHQD